MNAAHFTARPCCFTVAGGVQMVSVYLMRPALAADTDLTVRTVADLVASADRFRIEVAKANPGQSFKVTVTISGRKPSGFDAAKASFQPVHDARPATE